MNEEDFETHEDYAQWRRDSGDPYYDDEPEEDEGD